MFINNESPYKTTDLFSVLDVKLIELLRGLSEADWRRPTLARQWIVKDIAAHLLDGNLRSLSTSRITSSDRSLLQMARIRMWFVLSISLIQIGCTLPKG